MKALQRIASVRTAIIAVLLALSPLEVSYATGPVTIVQMVHCSDYGGTVYFQLSDGMNVFIYDGTDQFSKNLQALMVAVWVSGKNIQAHAITSNSGSGCGLYGGQLASVAVN